MMKKYLFGLCALLACIVLASCSGNPTKRIENLTKKIEDGKDMSAKEVYSIQKDFVKAQIDFYKSDPTEDEIDEFKDAVREYEKAFWDIDTDKNFEKEAKKIDDSDMKDLEKELKKAKKEFDKQQKKKKKDEDDD